MKKSRMGFSLIELLIVLSILAILAMVAIPNIMEYYKNYKYQQYVLEVESTLKWARMVAMERSINTAICSGNNRLVVYDMATNRDITCQGHPALRSVLVEQRDLDFVQISVNGGTGFDPRGFALGTSNIEVRRMGNNPRCVRYTITGLSSLIQREVCQ